MSRVHLIDVLDFNDHPALLSHEQMDEIEDRGDVLRRTYWGSGRWYLRPGALVPYVVICVGCDRLFNVNDSLKGGCCERCVSNYWVEKSPNPWQAMKRSRFVYRESSPEAVSALDEFYKQLAVAEEESRQERRRLKACQQQFKQVRKLIQKTDLPALRSLAKELKQAKTSAT